MASHLEDPIAELLGIPNPSAHISNTNVKLVVLKAGRTAKDAHQPLLTDHLSVLIVAHHLSLVRRVELSSAAKQIGKLEDIRGCQSADLGERMSEASIVNEGLIVIETIDSSQDLKEGELSFGGLAGAKEEGEAPQLVSVDAAWGCASRLVLDFEGVRKEHT